MKQYHALIAGCWGRGLRFYNGATNYEYVQENAKEQIYVEADHADSRF